MIVRRLVWDEWNIEHIAKHNVSPEEVEKVCQSKHLLEKGRSGLYQAIGQTQDGRYLIIILAPRSSSFYPVTARDADDKEKRRFKRKI